MFVTLAAWFGTGFVLLAVEVFDFALWNTKSFNKLWTRIDWILPTSFRCDDLCTKPVQLILLQHFPANSRNREGLVVPAESYFRWQPNIVITPHQIDNRPEEVVSVSS